MKKTQYFFSFLFIFLIGIGVSKSFAVSSIETNFETEISVTSISPKTYDNVVFITWDGVRTKWIDESSQDGTLGNVSRVREQGYMQKMRIISHKTSTDPGCATIETGYSDDIHGIFVNQFGPGSAKLSIPDGYTIPERLKESFGDDIKAGYFMSWSYHQINEEYMNQEGNYTDSIFENVKIGEDVDYWLGSENFSWVPTDPESLNASWHGLASNDMFYDPLIRAEYLGMKMAEFISENKDERFYIRSHMTEPDNVGHGYFESENGEITPEYLQALIDCDLATGYVLDALEANGLLDDTLVIIGTDHGFYKETHDGDSWPSNRIEVTEQLFAISDIAIKTPQDTFVAQMDIAPTILSVLGVDLSTITPAYAGDENSGTPFWDRIDAEAPIVSSIKYKSDEFYLPQPVENGTKIKEAFDLYLNIQEWTNISEATLTTDVLTLDATEVSNTLIVWEALNDEIGDGTHELSIQIEDGLGFVTEIILKLKAGSAPYNMFLSLLALPILAIPIVLRKRK